MAQTYSKDAVERRRHQRQQDLEAELERITRILAAQPDIHRVILFGSLARGDSREHSDLDLVVIQQTDQPFLERIEAVHRLVLPVVDVDLLVYTPSEFEQLAADRAFVRRVKEQGRVVYDSVA